MKKFLGTLLKQRLGRGVHSTRAFTPHSRLHKPAPLLSPPPVPLIAMEAQIAATQPVAVTQSQRPTTQTQAYDPTAQTLQADADEGALDEPSVRRGVSTAPPRRIAHHARPVLRARVVSAYRVSQTPLDPLALPSSRTALPFLTRSSPSRLTRPPQYEQLPQPFVPIEELQNCGISMTDIKVRTGGSLA